MTEEREELGMYAMHNEKPCPFIKVGEYTICRQAEGRMWIEHSKGEGAEFSEAKFLKVIEDFYNANF